MLHNYFANKFFSVFYDFLNPVNWVIETTFQLIEPFDQSKDSCFNKGWIHTDDNKILAGVLYLTPNADLETGTSIYMPKDVSSESNLLADSQLKKYELYRDGLKPDDYSEHINKFNSNFVETVNVKNMYNRLIAFDATCWHSAQNFHTNTESRLTVNFFVTSVNSSSAPPIERIKRYKF
jgi:hypothetical protein